MEIYLRVGLNDVGHCQKGNVVVAVWESLVSCRLISVFGQRPPDELPEARETHVAFLVRLLISGAFTGPELSHTHTTLVSDTPSQWHPLNPSLTFTATARWSGSFVRHSADVKARRFRAPTRLILNIHGHPASRPVPQEARPNPDSETALVLLRARADSSEAPEPVQSSGVIVIRKRA